MTIKKLSDTMKNKSMSKLLDEYDYNRPRRGQFMDAEIMQIEHDRILVDLGAKTDAVVPVRELKNTDESILEDLTEGDMVPVYIMQPPTMMQKPTVSLQRGIEKQDWNRAEQLLESKEIIQLRIVDHNKGGLLVKFGNLEGFLPASLMSTVARASNREMAEKIKSNLIGERVYMSVIEVKSKADRLIFSARENQDEIKQKMYQELQPGDIRNGIVVNLVEFGAFVDLFGVDGLLHISELGWIRREHPSEVLSLGDKIEVKVLDVDPENGRIGLSRKALINPVEAYDISTETLN
ncbi:MAG: S1 RNA-binding domain-containing protein [Anaerolineales bacterium]